MSHDDDHATCTGHSHIMSGEWVKGRNPSDLSWSPCSRDDLEKFLRSKASSCLLHTDPRSRYQVRLPPKLPGMHYSADEQCQILFGTNATFCNDMESTIQNKADYNFRASDHCFHSIPAQPEPDARDSRDTGFTLMV
ncbi:A disintegrin and metalloproteinase with thrombospondin motifs 17-like [Salvelinus fontinalis]|uniref:A disintegrin and metalloproteinase with thrombospondin motifs 17-like n=1 Tax=Salvelinus fontinalis TaxID=8038 RepID=UPI0024857A27|nr:A disintegrin and metalloproteinase with thrombospondin motifs 17-like [Salvelinus fontinalis]